MSLSSFTTLSSVSRRTIAEDSTPGNRLCLGALLYEVVCWTRTVHVLVEVGQWAGQTPKFMRTMKVYFNCGPLKIPFSIWDHLQWLGEYGKRNLLS